jgi:hypothetical protein
MQVSKNSPKLKITNKLVKDTNLTLNGEIAIAMTIKSYGANQPKLRSLSGNHPK